MGSMTTSVTEKHFIRAEVARIGARRILEIGAFKGETTAILCEAVAAQGGHVVVIDPMTWAAEAMANGIGVPLPDSWARRLAFLRPILGYEGAFWSNLRAAGYEDLVTLFRSVSTDPRLLRRKHPLLESFDLVFIDGDHTLEGAQADMQNWGTRVRPGGVILFHDVQPRFPGVVSVFRSLDQQGSYRISQPTESGTIGRVEVLRGVEPNPTAAGGGFMAPQAGVR
jgi:predicted O-methyltransferase YrrM